MNVIQRMQCNECNTKECNTINAILKNAIQWLQFTKNAIQWMQYNECKTMEYIMYIGRCT